MTKKNDIEARVTRAKAEHSKASELAARAAGVAGEAEAAHAKASAAYAIDADETAAAGVLRARDVRDLANARHAHAASVRVAAQLELDAAELAATEARVAEEAEAARVAEARRVQALRERAALETYQARTRAAAVAIVQAEQTIRESLSAISSAWSDVNAASAELRAAGEDVPDLDAIHLLGPVALVRGSCVSSPDLIAQINPSNVLAGFAPFDQIAEPTPEETTRSRRKLALYLSARSTVQAQQILSDDVAREHAERAAALDALYLAGDADELERRRKYKIAAPALTSPLAAPPVAPAPGVLDRARAFFSGSKDPAAPAP